MAIPHPENRKLQDARKRHQAERTKLQWLQSASGQGTTEPLRPRTRRGAFVGRTMGLAHYQFGATHPAIPSASVPRRQLHDGVYKLPVCKLFRPKCLVLLRLVRPYRSSLFRERKRTTFTSPPCSQTWFGLRLVSCERSVGTHQRDYDLPTPPETARA